MFGPFIVSEVPFGANNCASTVSNERSDSTIGRNCTLQYRVMLDPIDLIGLNLLLLILIEIIDETRRILNK